MAFTKLVLPSLTPFFTGADRKPVDQSEFARGFQAVLRVLEIRQRPFYNTRHTFISVALTLGCNQKWIAEQTGTSIAMIQEHYGKFIRDDGDQLLRAYVEQSKRATEHKPEPLPEPSRVAGLSSGNHWRARQESNLYLGFRRPS